MPTASELLAIALQHHQAGHLSEAKQLYRHILSVEPNNADAWRLLGMLALSAEKHDVAASHLERAIALNPFDAEALKLLGIAFHQQRKIDKALLYYERALKLS